MPDCYITSGILPFLTIIIMKKFLIGLLAASMVGLSGCADSQHLGGKEYEPYGVFNEDAVRDPNVKYQVSFGSCVVALIFIETLVVPLYVIGWDLYEPVRIDTK